jgi:O-antigen/teichoic acid export membrane protein
MGTILPRLLNFLLTPLLTYSFAPAQFGINTELYSFIAFLNIIFIYGMETTFFNFNSKWENKEEVYNTTLSSLFVTTLILCLPFLLFSGSISELLTSPNAHYLPVFIVWSILIIATDTFAVIPYAKLRAESKALQFSVLKLLNVIINFGLTVFFLVYCKKAYETQDGSRLAELYNPEIGIGYAFLANLIANAVSLIFLYPQFSRWKFGVNRELLISMLHYTWPLIILGLAGNINDTADRLMIKWLIPDRAEAQNAQGIYGACYKIAILMNIFIQAFRFAADPFFFSKAKDKDSKQIYALVMKYFIIFCLLLFLATVLNLSWLQKLVDVQYRVGLGVVPILLLAYLCYGVVVNLSIWFKLSAQTRFGAVISVAGAVITLVVNIVFVPRYSYMACAWATLAAFAGMMVLSYWLGQKFFPIRYNLRAITVYAVIAFSLYFISFLFDSLESHIVRLVLNNLLIVIFGWIVYILEINNLKKLNKNVTPVEGD